MRFRKPKPEPDWERIISLHERDGSASRASADIIKRFLLDPANADRKTLLITSAAQGEGKTTMALHLGALLGSRGERVLLVDAHWGRPALGRILGVEERQGLTDLLAADVRDEDVLAPNSRLPTLSVLPGGTRKRDLFDTAAADRLGAFLKRMRVRFDFVLLDSAPTSSGSEALALSRIVDGVLLVVKCDGTQRSEVAASRAAIEQHAGKIVGVILSRVPGYLPAHYRTA